MSTTTPEAVTVTAITVQNPLPQQLIALSSELVAKRDGLAIRAAAVRISDPASLAEAEAVFVALDAFTKEVHTGRMEITRKLDALKAEIMDAESTAVDALKIHRDAVGRAITTFRAELRRIAEENARKAREAAEAEAKRLREEAEANAKREADRVAAEQKHQAEEAALFGDDSPAPVARPAPVVPVIPVVPTVAPIMAPAVPDLPRSAVKTQTRKRLVIDDPAKVIAEACKGGGLLYGRTVLVIDEKAIDAICRAGCAVPGARLEEYETIASNGRGR